jgi:hypothetical protein
MNSADLSANLKKHPIGVACALVSVACGILLYVRSSNIADSQRLNEERTAEANKMINNVRNSAGLAEQVAEVEGQRKELEGRLMKAGQLAVNLQYFYKLEAETEVKLVDVRQGNTPRNAKTQYIGVPFVVTIQGSFANVAGFLNRLQNGPHFCRINTATFNKTGGDNPGATDMSLSLSLEILGQP